MTSETHVDDYDENSVFNRLFIAEKRKPKPSKGDRLAMVFADAPAEPIRVVDFLPSY